MKKFLIYGGIAALVLVLGVFITMQFFLGGIVTKGVNKYGPGITQTTVELKSASISPFSGSGTLTGLTVGNPQGWSAPNAFYLGQIQVNMEPFSVMSDHIVINEIVIDQPEFTYETKLVSSNIGDLLKNIEQSTGGGQAEPKSDSGQPIKMVVKKLTLRNGKVNLGLGATAITLPLPPLELTDLGTAENGITPGNLAVAVMRAVTPQIVAASMQALAKAGGTSGAATAEGVKQVGEAIKGLFGGEKKK